MIPAAALKLMSVVFMIIGAAVGIHMFSYISHFRSANREVLKNSFVFAVRHFGVTLFSLALVLIAALITEAIPPLLAVLPALVCLGVNGRMEKMYGKYDQNTDAAVF